MISALSLLVLGFSLGMRHATDADHVVAVTTMVSRGCSLRSAVRVGALWGLGHTLTITSVGVVIILFNWMIPPRLGLLMELCVGLMLVALGAMNLREAVRTSEGAAGVKPAAPPGSTLRPLVVGTVHGLAGSAGITLLLLTTVREPMQAAAYLLVFGAGTIAGMMLITTAVAMPFAYERQGWRMTNGGLTAATGLLSLCFGLFLAYHIGVAQGLITAGRLFPAK